MNVTPYASFADLIIIVYHLWSFSNHRTDRPIAVVVSTVNVICFEHDHVVTSTKGPLSIFADISQGNVASNSMSLEDVMLS
jgi:hypothetical protein